MKKYFLVILITVTGNAAMAQQLQTSSLYDLQGVFHNAAMAGMGQNDFVGVTYRTQWSGISGAPKTATAFGSFKLPQYKIGIGGNIYNDKTGPTSRTGIQINLAKHIPVGNGGTFSLGIENRLHQYALDKAKLQATLGNDPAIGGSDNRFKYDAGFGVAYADKKLTLGAAVSQLVQSKLDFYSGNLTRNEEARLYRHYYFHGSYAWNPDGNTSITPYFLGIYLPNAPGEFQVGARVEHNKTLWWGLGYRSKQSFTASAGVNINKKFSIGYSYDDYLTPISRFDGGSNAHEFIVRYNLIKQ